MHGDLISVIVPAYNNAPWLPRCLDSLLAQTYPNMEILVVNDGSTDDTIAALEAYTAGSSRIRAIHQENGGVTRARLRGVAEAKGDWIGFVDGDDEVEPQMYARLLDNAKTHKADISHCGFQVIDPDGQVSYLHNTQILCRQDRLTALRDLLEERIVEPSLCTKLFKRSLFDDLENKMDASIKNNEDMLMNYYLFEKADTAVFEDVCPYHYLLRRGSASRSRLNRHIVYDPIRVRQRILDTCIPEMREDAHRALARMCLVSYRQLVMEKGKEYAQDRIEVRRLIAQQLPYVDLLPKRNALLVKMISTIPWAFDLTYAVYDRLTNKRKA